MKEHISNCFPHYLQFPRNVQALRVLVKNILPSIIYTCMKAATSQPGSSKLEVFGDYWQIFQKLRRNFHSTDFFFLTPFLSGPQIHGSNFFPARVDPNSSSFPRPLPRVLSSLIAHSPPQHQLQMPPSLSFMEQLRNWGVLEAGSAGEEAATISKKRDHKDLPAANPE